MRNVWFWILGIAILGLGGTLADARVSPTAFTYQGQLKDGDTGVDAPTARIVFRLWDAETGGTQVGSDAVIYPVSIVDGLFTATPDFGESAFSGAGRWLEIGIDVTGGTTYTWLTPRQPVTSAPSAVYALHSGDSVWTLNGSNISYTAGNVGIGLSNPSYPLEVATGSATRAISALSTYTDTGGAGLYGESRSTDGSGVLGKATAGSGSPVGVRGDATSTEGIGVRGYAGATSGTPTGVFGGVRYAGGIGVKGANTASTGNGIAVYGEASSTTGFGGYFVGRGYFSGRLGVGTSSPASELDVNGTATMTGFRLNQSPTDGYVLMADASGNGTWQPSPSGGIGGSGSPYYLPRFTNSTTLGSSSIYETSGGNIGIGTTVPSTKLHVVGTVRTQGFQLYSSPAAGYVLTSDATGTGTWQAPTGGGGLTLPYSGSVSSSSVAFSVTNTGTGISSNAVVGIINNASSHSDAAAGSFNANGSNGSAVNAFSDRGTSVHVQYTGTKAYAFYGTSSGAGGGYFSCSKAGGFGIKALASNTADNTSTRAGWFVCEGVTGHAVEANANGSNTIGVYATAEGNYGWALYGSATGTNGIGLVASGAKLAAKLYGNMALYEYGTTTKVLELGKGLDYAEGFDVSDTDTEVAAGTVLVIDSSNAGRLTRCHQAYDRKVAGIVAGANGLGSGVRLGAGQFDHDVALAGRVYCNVIALEEEVQPGDLLTTSDVPGYAMKVRDHARAQGAVLGKAMQPLRQGERGQILVLVTLQ